MKKIILSLIIMSLSLSLVSCVSSNNLTNTSSESTIVSSETPESSEESQEELESSTTESSETASSEAETSSEVETPNTSEENNLPAPTDNEEFNSLFMANEIDSTYSKDILFAASITQMVDIEVAATSNWEREINYAYTKLLGLVADDAINSIEAEQSAWFNDIQLVIQSIQNEYSGEDPMSKVYIAHDIMIHYRDRAADLMNKVYEEAGTIEFAPEEGEVLG